MPMVMVDENVACVLLEEDCVAFSQGFLGRWIPVLKGAPLSVFMAIAMYRGRNRYFGLSYGALSHCTRLSETAIKEALRKLRRLGLLVDATAIPEKDIDMPYEQNPSLHRMKVLDRTGGRCSYCGSRLDGTWHIDHMIPSSRGGGSGLSNLTPACAECNSVKSSMTISEYRAWLEQRTGKPVAFLIDGEQT
jgi:hypothetical protein